MDRWEYVMENGPQVQVSQASFSGDLDLLQIMLLWNLQHFKDWLSIECFSLAVIMVLISMIKVYVNFNNKFPHGLLNVQFELFYYICSIMQK